ncbi:MAG: ATP-binding protein, partial [Candidatus Cloacimonadaceae bacterium]|nr:ATP-binding protein [Candidatus Cloacimonadaceae bacterium]
IMKLWRHDSNQAVPQPFDILKQIAANGRKSDIFYLKTNEKGEQDLSISCTAVFNANQDISSYLIILQDVTQKKQEEEEKIKAHKLEAVSSLSAGLAHDFNNILTGIMANISLVMDDLPEHSDLYTLLKAAEDGTIKGKALTDHLLTFANGKHAEPAVSETESLVVSVVDRLLHDTKIRVSYRFNRPLPDINIPAEPFNRIVQNIISNAIQAMDIDGNLIVNASEQDGFVSIHFIDDGDGIETASLSKVFEPYWTTRENSSGLGLTTVQSLLRKHDGTVRITSVKGSGTDVEIRIPIAATQNGQETRPVAAVNARNTLILMDDNPFRKTLADLLKRLNQEIFCTANPDEMMRIFEGSRLRGNPIMSVIIDADMLDV